MSLPLSLHVICCVSAPRLSPRGEYSDAAAGLMGTAPAMNALIRFSKNVPWISQHEGVLSLPGTQAFDANDRLVARPDFERLDRWLALASRQTVFRVPAYYGNRLQIHDTERFRAPTGCVDTGICRTRSLARIEAQSVLFPSGRRAHEAPAVPDDRRLHKASKAS